MKNGILSCPHCGSKPRIKIINYHSGPQYKIECSNDCQSENDRDEVIKNWNSRADFAEVAS